MPPTHTISTTGHEEVVDGVRMVFQMAPGTEGGWTTLRPGEKPMMKKVRFRTLGCYPLTGAVESTAATLPEIIQEMLLTTTSERQGRMIDHDSVGSMEKKKQEGYF